MLEHIFHVKHALRRIIGRLTYRETLLLVFSNYEGRPSSINILTVILKLLTFQFGRIAKQAEGPSQECEEGGS